MVLAGEESATAQSRHDTRTPIQGNRFRSTQAPIGKQTPAPSSTPDPTTCASEKPNITDTPPRPTSHSRKHTQAPKRRYRIQATRTPIYPNAQQHHLQNPDTKYIAEKSRSTSRAPPKTPWVQSRPRLTSKLQSQQHRNTEPQQTESPATKSLGTTLPVTLATALTEAATRAVANPSVTTLLPKHWDWYQFGNNPRATFTAAHHTGNRYTQPILGIRTHKTEAAPTTLNSETNKTGKFSNLRHHSFSFNSVTKISNRLSQQLTPHKHKPASINCPNLTHTICKSQYKLNHSFSLLHKAQLHAQEGGGDISIIQETHHKTSTYCTQQMAYRGKAVHEAIMRSPIDTTMEDPEDTMVIDPSQTKRTQEARKGGSSSKRKKNTELPTGLKDTPRDFWLGIMAMEKLAIEEGIKTKDCRPYTKKEDLIKSGISEEEAEELSHPCKVAFPHVKQLLYPLERPDGKGGQHFNLTQLPIETEVDPGTGLSLDYHIAVHFERPSTDYTHVEILNKATTRLALMGIELGTGLAEPIYIPCKEKEKNSKIKYWTGTIKIHLKHPRVDGIGMLKGLRPFLLSLDSIQTLGKTCKCYDSIARNTLLSTKIENPKLHLISASELQRDVLIESFRRGYDYEIASVQKVKEETWGWLISTTPTQANRIIQYLVPYKQELMHVITPQAAKEERRNRGEGLTEEEIKKKNATMLCLYGLHKMKKIEDTKDSIKAVIGELNVASFYFPGQVGELHKGTANVQCLNAIVYRQWVGKTVEIFGKHVSFVPHPKSLQGTIPPTKEEQEKLGFCDISTAIVDTLEATRNAPQNKGKNAIITPKDLDALVETAMDKRNGQLITELKAELTAELHKEMGDFKKEVTLEADVREERITRNLTTHVKNQLTEIRKQLALTSEAVNMTTKALDSILTPTQPQLEN